MSTQKIEVVLTLEYEDDTTRNYTFEDVAPSDLSGILPAIKAVNANENDAYANFYNTFVSKEGAKVRKIVEGRIISTQEDEIYNG